MFRGGKNIFVVVVVYSRDQVRGSFLLLGTYFMGYPAELDFYWALGGYT